MTTSFSPAAAYIRSLADLSRGDCKQFLFAPDKVLTMCPEYTVDDIGLGTKVGTEKAGRSVLSS